MRRLLIIPLLFFVACGDDEETICVREYSNRIEPLFEREKVLADEYALFLREAETGSALVTGSRASLLERYDALATEVDAVPAPCSSVESCHGLIEEAVASRRTSIQRMVEAEAIGDEFIEIARKITEWNARPDVAERAALRAPFVESLDAGRGSVLHVTREFGVLSTRLVEAANGALPETIRQICAQSERLMSPLDRTSNRESLVLVLRGGLDNVAKDHAILVERAKIVVPPSGPVAEAWVAMVELLEVRQQILSQFVALQRAEKEIRALDARLVDYDRLGREQKAAQSRFEGALRDAVIRDQAATKKLAAFQVEIQKLRARVL